MSQNVERTEAIKKIRKLREQTIDQGRTEAEAMMAMEKMGELLETYNISMSEVDLSGQECQTLTVDSGAVISQPIDNAITAIGKLTDTICWHSKGRKQIRRDANGSVVYTKTGRYQMDKGNITYNFFGLESDVLMAEHLYNIIQDAIKTELKAFKKSATYLESFEPKKRLSHNFQFGMVDRIRGRLLEQREAMLENIERERAKLEVGSSDIMVLKDAKVKEAFKTSGPALRSRSANNRVRFNAGYAAGAAAAEKVNLSRPIESGRASGGAKAIEGW